ncbi:MAG: hypothetical protein ACXVPQ_08845 [Bacteroidia bacterium]
MDRGDGLIAELSGETKKVNGMIYLLFPALVVVLFGKIIIFTGVGNKIVTAEFPY